MSVAPSRSNAALQTSLSCAYKGSSWISYMVTSFLISAIFWMRGSSARNCNLDDSVGFSLSASLPISSSSGDRTSRLTAFLGTRLRVSVSPDLASLTPLVARHSYASFSWFTSRIQPQSMNRTPIAVSMMFFTISSSFIKERIVSLIRSTVCR